MSRSSSASVEMKKRLLTNREYIAAPMRLCPEAWTSNPARPSERTTDNALFVQQSVTKTVLMILLQCYGYPMASIFGTSLGGSTLVGKSPGVVA